MRDRTSVPDAPVVKFKVAKADEIAGRRGLTGVVEKAAFFGVTHHNYSRVVNDVNFPGRDFIASVLRSPAAAAFPEDVTFDNLFEVA